MRASAIHLTLLLVLGGCGRLGYESSPGSGALGHSDAGADLDARTASEGGSGDSSTQTAVPRCGDGVVDDFERCDDGNVRSGDGCSADCSPEVCGNGRRDTGEDCDDANSDDQDGCTNDCHFSCASASDCDDGNECNGAESCGSVSHQCEPGASTAAGTPCAGGLCQAGLCIAESCGNARRDTGEQCDDGNDVPGDGCELDCTFTCVSDLDCGLDRNACNGTEACDPSTHRCETSPPLTDGERCDRDGDGVFTDACQDASCVTPVCGDGVAHEIGGEDCDDGNTTNGDGCDNDCTYSCSIDRDCSDDNLCNGDETCNLGSHQCELGTPPSGGVISCPGGTCEGSTCVPSGGGGCETSLECAADSVCCPGCPRRGGFCYSAGGRCPVLKCPT